MINHLFRLIWNKKKQNFLLLTEMLISFLVLFAVFTLLVYFYNNYRKPMGFDYKPVWAVTFSRDNQTERADSITQFFESVKRTLLAIPQVKEVSYCSQNVPFSQNTMQSGLDHKGKQVRRINMYSIEDSYLAVTAMQLKEGRWFNKTDQVYKYKPVVINEKLRVELFGTGKALGELIGDGKEENKAKVIGVIKDAKTQGDYSDQGFAEYIRMDTGSFKWTDNMLIKVAPTADAAFEAKLYKTLAGSLKNSNIEIEHLEHKLTSINYFALVPMIVLSIICTFLIVNVALGLFGVLWYNINKRKGEIGLRKAIGASGSSISWQLVTESMLLATLALIVGSFFAIQFPLLHVFDLSAGIYVTALILSIIFVYVLVLICSLYPGKQAAAIYPAIALHED
jgi:putative ABC transport system permease protein